MNRRLVEKQGFRLEKLARPLKVKNVDESDNSRWSVTHKVEVNMYFKKHVE